MICHDSKGIFTLYLYETTKLELAKTLDFPGTLRSASWSLDGRTLAAWGEDSTTQQVRMRAYEV